MKTINSRILAATVVAALSLGVARNAVAQELVLNGNFTETNIVSPAPTYAATAAGGELTYNIGLTGWANLNNGYNFVMTPGSADTTGVNSSYGNLQLWGSNNGGTNAITAPPTGGNILAADGAFNVGAIEQTITGLTAGQQYTLSFSWAAAQQHGFTGNTTESWTASLGAESFSTITYDLNSHTFSGWMDTNFTFTATGSSEVLKFLAAGTPSGEPPFSLLAGVSMEATGTPTPAPEPTTIQYAAVLLLVPFVGRTVRRFRKQSQA